MIESRSFHDNESEGYQEGSAPPGVRRKLDIPRPLSSQPSSLAKLCGADIELANYIHGCGNPRDSTAAAARAILAEIPGVPASSIRRTSCRCPAGTTCTCGYDPQDLGRKFLYTNGGCVYIDLNHLELCLPEVLGAHDHVAAWHGMLRIARDAMDRANARLPEGQRIVVFANNSDGHNSSYGSHLNFTLSRRAFENLFVRKPHHLQYLASFLSSSAPLTGAGKVGSENGRPVVDYQISQRADFFVVLTGVQTTFDRPIVNSRDECHADWETMARLHVIFFDNTLCHGSSLLKVGTTQLVLAMLEDEQVNPGLLADDPVEAVVAWSHDPELKARAPLVSGARYTAVELQRAFCDEARRFVDSGKAEGIVPRAAEILWLWEDTVERLEKDPRSLAPRIDWLLKRSILERAMDRHRLSWTSPQIKYLDHVYSSLDRDEGLYWIQERSGETEQLVSPAQIERLVHAPPGDTRAWGRAMLLRRWGAQRVESMDWDSIRFRTHEDDYWSRVRCLDMSDPFSFTRRLAGPLMARGGDLAAVLDRLTVLESTGARIPPGVVS